MTTLSRDALAQWARLAGFEWTEAELDAIAGPLSRVLEGLPIGMQLVGRPFDEATVLRTADAYQRATDWYARRPPLA